MSPSALLSPSTVATAPAKGMGFDSLPPLLISPTIFEFVKSLDLRTVGKDLGDVPPVFGWKLVPYEPIMVESGHEGSCTVRFTDVLDEHFFNFDPLSSSWVILVMSLTLLWRSNPPRPFHRPPLDRVNGVPNFGLRPPCLDLLLHLFVDLKLVVRVLPQSYHPKEVVKPAAKKSTSKSAKKSTHSPPQRTHKTPKQNEASEQEPEQVEEVEPSTIRTPSKKELFQNRCKTGA